MPEKRDKAQLGSSPDKSKKIEHPSLKRGDNNDYPNDSKTDWPMRVLIPLQKFSDNGPIRQALRRAPERKENNTGLPDNLKSSIEDLSGISLDDVKIRYNSDKPAKIGAFAYTQGAEIHIGPGQEQHLPHEAWHVVQQKQGRVKPKVYMKKARIHVNDDYDLEKEADVQSAKALQQSGNNENKQDEYSPLASSGNTSKFSKQSDLLHTTTSSIASPIQGRFYGQVLDDSQRNWNAIIDYYVALHDDHPLGNIDEINAYVETAEAEWYGDDNHSASVNQFNSFVTLKAKIKSGLEGLRENPQDAGNLDWDEIVPYLTDHIHAHGFITITHRNGPLQGGHGNGTTWTATGGPNGVRTGTVPENAHGANDGALNGARGTVRSVITDHNEAVDAEKAVVDGLAT